MPEKYVVDQDTIVGGDIFLFVDEGGTKLPIAFGTSAGVDRSLDTVEASSKMGGKYKDFVAGQIGATITCDSLISKTDGHMSYKTLKGLQESKTPIPFVVGEWTKDPLTGEYAPAETWESGKGFIQSLNMKADNGAICTSSISIQVTGPLV